MTALSAMSVKPSSSSTPGLVTGHTWVTFVVMMRPAKSPLDKGSEGLRSTAAQAFFVGLPAHLRGRNVSDQSIPFNTSSPPSSREHDRAQTLVDLLFDEMRAISPSREAVGTRSGMAF